MTPLLAWLIGAGGVATGFILAAVLGSSKLREIRQHDAFGEHCNQALGLTREDT